MKNNITIIILSILLLLFIIAGLFNIKHTSDNDITPPLHDSLIPKDVHLASLDSLLLINDSLIKDNEVKTRMIIYLNDELIFCQIRNEELKDS